jgi:hypothetical protein
VSLPAWLAPLAELGAVVEARRRLAAAGRVEISGPTGSTSVVHVGIRWLM